jgi:hypothetical protein
MRKTVLLTTVLLSLSLNNNFGQSSSNSSNTVRIWEEPTIIPTYLVGLPSTSPRFYDGQRLQGKETEAYKNLYQATWSFAFHSAAYFQSWS